MRTLRRFEAGGVATENHRETRLVAVVKVVGDWPGQQLVGRHGPVVGQTRRFGPGRERSGSSPPHHPYAGTVHDTGPFQDRIRLGFQNAQG